MPDLKNLIVEQLNFLETLKTQLEQELHLISSRDAESLTKLINAKSEVLVQIDNQDKLISKAYASDYNDKNKDQIDPLFEQAKGLIEQCKYRTEINAKAVEQGQLRLDHLRNLLLEARSKESMTYDKSGKTQGRSHTKSTSA